MHMVVNKRNKKANVMGYGLIISICTLLVIMLVSFPMKKPSHVASAKFGKHIIFFFHGNIMEMWVIPKAARSSRTPIKIIAKLQAVKMI